MSRFFRGPTFEVMLIARFQRRLLDYLMEKRHNFSMYIMYILIALSKRDTNYLSISYCAKISDFDYINTPNIVVEYSIL